MSKTERAPTPAIMDIETPRKAAPKKLDPELPTMRLREMYLRETPRIPGLRSGEVNRIECDKPGSALAGWRVIVRGPDVIFVTTPGWDPSDDKRRNAKPTDPCLSFVIPRLLVLFSFISNDPLELAQGIPSNFESLPLGWRPPEPVVEDPDAPAAPIPSHEMGDD